MILTELTCLKADCDGHLVEESAGLGSDPKDHIYRCAKCRCYVSDQDLAEYEAHLARPHRPNYGDGCTCGNCTMCAADGDADQLWIEHLGGQAGGA